MKLSFSSVFNKLTLAAAVVASVSGCDDPEYPTPTPATTGSTAQGLVQVVNASPGSGDAQLRSIDNTNTTAFPSAVPYLGTSGYSNVPAGQRLLAYSTPNNLSNNLVFARGVFNTSTNSTVFLTDLPTRASTSTDQGGLRSVVLLDNLAAPASGRARIRFINLSPSYSASADSLGLYTIASPSASGSTAPNRFLFGAIGRTYRSIAYTIPAVIATPTTPGRASRNLAFQTFTDVPAGNYTFAVRRGFTTNNPQQVIVPATNLTFASGKIYTIYTRGLVNNANLPLGLSVVTHN